MSIATRCWPSMKKVKVGYLNLYVKAHPPGWPRRWQGSGPDGLDGSERLGEPEAGRPEDRERLGRPHHRRRRDGHHLDALAVAERSVVIGSAVSGVEHADQVGDDRAHLAVDPARPGARSGTRARARAAGPLDPTAVPRRSRPTSPGDVDDLSLEDHSRVAVERACQRLDERVERVVVRRTRLAQTAPDADRRARASRGRRRASRSRRPSRTRR